MKFKSLFKSKKLFRERDQSESHSSPPTRKIHRKLCVNTCTAFSSSRCMEEEWDLTACPLHFSDLQIFVWDTLSQNQWLWLKDMLGRFCFYKNRTEAPTFRWDNRLITTLIKNVSFWVTYIKRDQIHSILTL